MTSKKTGYLLGAVAGIGVAAAALAATDVGVTLAEKSAPAMPVIRASTAPIFAPPPGAPLSFADIFEQVSPAVVSVNVKSRADASALRRIPGFEGLPFGIIPRAPGGEEGEEEQQGPTQMSAGSGFFISADGYIVTNNHVVENAEEIKVVLKDERELDAEIIGRDEATDLAVLKVKGANFPFVSFENDAVPRVGDWVIAVGNPFGLTATATSGIVSAYGRDIGETFVDFIQIDAPINRGNSGGPTFDIYGRVIGVNSAIFSPTGGSVGIGFAIPASLAKPITDRLMRGETIERGYLGVEIGDLDPWRESMGLPDTARGAFVNSVTADGPADRAGLQAGDIVVGLNGTPIVSSSDLTRRVGRAKAGDTLRIEILRNNRRQTLNVRSGTRPSQADLLAGNGMAAPDAPPVAATPTGQVVAGLNLAALTPALRQRYDLPAEVDGVVVTGVAAGGDRRFQPGFVILRAGTAPAQSVADVQAAVAASRQAGRDNVFLLVRTPEGNRPVALELPKAD